MHFQKGQFQWCFQQWWNCWSHSLIMAGTLNTVGTTWNITKVSIHFIIHSVQNLYIHPCVKNSHTRVGNWQLTNPILEGRQATAMLGSFSRSVAVSRGCPQGGVLSPLLWCLVVDDLLARLCGGGLYAQGYADDICLLAVGKFPNTVSRLIQWAFSIVEVWCAELSLSVNPDKIGLVAFTRRKNLKVSLNPGFLERHYNAPCRSSIWE